MTLPIFDRARRHRNRIALRDAVSTYTYGDLLNAADRVAGALLDSRADLEGKAVAFLVEPSFAWVAMQWGIWRAGGTAVPLALAQAPPEHDYTLTDSRSILTLASPKLVGRLRAVAERRGLRCRTTTELLAGKATKVPILGPERPAMIVYTSGTTGQPKGAVLSHGNLEAQVRALEEAWGWTADDSILEFLPLHHVHGIVNIVTCALWSGARCDILEKFDAEEVWRRIETGELTLLMAVPTIYRRLITTWEQASAERQKTLSEAAAKLRLMVSGSAALPVPVLERWQEITQQVLLERYGMTEIGMALSNPLAAERRPGTVGRPLPGVEARLVDEDGGLLAAGLPGEIEIRGASVFKGYFGRREVTRQSFRDGWFRTGDIAVREDDGFYRILGRSSVDIIKSGGEKVSALEIEAVLREHPAIAECAVVGLPDPDWGETVAATLVLEEGQELTLETLRQWAREHLAGYKTPRRICCVEELPRNAMGKVIKPEVSKLFEE
jgi:malonyl-CoA/methylmalonyl-CoA synthetase